MTSSQLKVHSMAEEKKEDSHPVQESRGVSADPDRPAKKCKGGRKLIYATLEQRKQRNRDAQAAFRERRTEHIAELEKTVEEQKVKLQASQAAHTSSKDECLLLRYKNSLLERILLENGIDVNTELNKKFDLRSEISSRPIKEKPRHRNTVLAPLVPRKHHSHAGRSASALPVSPPNTSPCCTHCTSHSAPSPQQQISPLLNEPSPPFETQASLADVQLQNSTHSNHGHSNKRRRYDPPVISNCHKRQRTGMMQKYDSYQQLHYPQTAFGLAPDTQASRMTSQHAFQEQLANDPLAGLFHSPDSTKHLDPQCSTHATETIDCHDSDDVPSSEAHSAYSSPNYPPTQVQVPYVDSKALDFDQGPITQLMGSYDSNFEMDLEFLSSIQT